MTELISGISGLARVRWSEWYDGGETGNEKMRLGDDVAEHRIHFFWDRV